MAIMLNKTKHKKPSYKLILLFILIVFFIACMQSRGFAMSPFNIPAIPEFPTIISNRNTYHVDKDIGSNLNDGSSQYPWATLQYGIDQLNAGDTLIVHAASTGYKEFVTISNSGTENNWITIKGLDGLSGEKAIIQDNNLTFDSSASYVLFENIDINGKGWSTLALFSSSHHLAFDNVEIDCQGSNDNYTGILVNEGINDVWFRNMDIHHCGYKKLNPTDASGVYMRRQSSGNLINDITFINVTVRDNKGDGIGGAAVDSVYFNGCIATNNSGDGFDIGAKIRAVFINTVSAENGIEPGILYQGVGFKTWSKETWLIKSLVYNNYYDGILFQPHEDNSKFYMLNSTFMGDDFYNRRGWGSNQVYLYNNIFYSVNSPAVIFEDVTKQTLAGEDNNYYFSANNTIAFKYKDANQVRNYTFSEMGNRTWYAATGHGLNNIGKVATETLPDPGFTDLANNDFSLKRGSLAVDAGIDVGLIIDVDGNTIICDPYADIGAFELCSSTDITAPSPPKVLRLQ